MPKHSNIFYICIDNPLNMRQGTLFNLLKAFLIVSTVFFLSSCRENKVSLHPTDNEGAFSLEDIKDEIVLLHGAVPFYWETFELKNSNKNYTTLKLPEAFWTKGHFNSRGFGTYRITLNGLDSLSHYTLKIPKTISAIEVWANSTLISNSGTIGKNIEDEIPSGKVIYAELPKASTIKLYLKVSNYNHRLGGGFSSGILISKKEVIAIQKENSILIDLLLSCILFLFGAYQVFQFYISKYNKLFLFLGLFCLFGGLRQLFVGEVYIYNMFPNIPFWLVQDVRYIAYYLCMLFTVLYHYTLYPENSITPIVNLFKVMIPLGLIYVLLTPNYYSTLAAPIYQCLGLLLVLFGIYTVMIIIKRKLKYALIISVGIITTILILLNDLLFSLHYINTGYYIQYGLIFYILIQSFINYKEQLSRLKNIDALSRRVSLLSDEVKEKREEITNLVITTLEHLKFKNKLSENLDNLTSNPDNELIKTMSIDLKIDKLQTNKSILLLENIEKINFDFVKRLKKEFPHLTKTDIEIASLIRIGLSRTEMSTIRNVSLEAIKKNKIRLKKKINLNREDSLEDFLVNF